MGASSASMVAPARRITAGSPQQESLWAELASDSQRSVISEARAGSGKSSTCREAMWRMLDRDPGLAGLIRYAVFNKQNAVEFRADCPPGVDVGTVHSFGYAALQKSCSSRLEKNKSYLILDDVSGGKNLPRYLRRSIAAAVSLAKNHGLVPGREGIDKGIESLTVHYDIECYGQRPLVVGKSVDVLAKSAECDCLVDFDDMVWLPGVLGLQFADCDALFLDEIQDWNHAQLSLVPRLCSGGRVIAVGDRFQAIYAFRGADVDSIPRLRAGLSKRDAGLAEMPLTITWRCPKRHVELARQLVSDIEARPDAEDGEVGWMEWDESLDAFQPGDMVLCPTNAPLVKAALAMIGMRRRAVVRGRAVGDQLLQVVRAAGESRTVAELSRRVEAWMSRELARLVGMDGTEDLIESVQDRAAGVQAVLSSVGSPSEVEPTITSLFSEDVDPRRTPTSVVFSTVHRAKGLEANSVYLLEAPARTPRREWEIRQAQNLRYVALTRSRRSLTFVTA